jgi:hypothetical protein
MFVLQLYDLPEEVLVNIISYLDARGMDVCSKASSIQNYLSLYLDLGSGFVRMSVLSCVHRSASDFIE